VDYCSNNLPDDIFRGPQSSLVSKYILGLNFVDAQKRQMGGKGFCRQFWVELPATKPVEEPVIVSQPETDRIIVPLLIGAGLILGAVLLWEFAPVALPVLAL
jgi:hypothetical protein